MVEASFAEMAAMYGALALFAPGMLQRAQVRPPSALRASTPVTPLDCDTPLTYRVLGSSAAASRVVALKSSSAIPKRFHDLPASSERQTWDTPSSICTLTATAATFP